MFKKIKRTLKRDWQYWGFLALPLIYLIVFEYYPMLGAQIAFRDFTAKGGIWNSKWVGLKHFIRFFESYQFDRVVVNTIVLSFYSQMVGTVIPIVFALLFNCVEKPRLKKRYRLLLHFLILFQ